MKRKAIAIISFVLLLALFVTALPACRNTEGTDFKSTDETVTDNQSGDVNDSNAESNDETEDTESEADTESEDEGKLDIKNGELIESANKYAGGVQAFFEDGNRTQFTVKNSEMSLTYTRAASGDQLVSSIKGADGDYITDTMDVFVKMKNVFLVCAPPTLKCWR